MKLRKILSYIFLVTLLAAPVVAQSPSPFGELNKTDKMPEEMEELKRQRMEEAGIRNEMLDQKKEAFQENRCEKLNAKIEQKKYLAQENHERHWNRHQVFAERLANLLDRLEEEGYDVTELRTALTEMEVLIDELNDAHETYMTKLEEMKEIDCENPDGSLGQAIKDAQAELKAIRDKLHEIKDYFQSEIKPLLLDIKTQMQEETETEEETEVEEENESEEE